jgi:hypothetical protein
VVVAVTLCLYLSFTTLPLYSLVAQMYPDAKRQVLARYIKRKHPDAMELLGLEDPDDSSGSGSSSSSSPAGSFSAGHLKQGPVAQAGIAEEEEEEGGRDDAAPGNRPQRTKATPGCAAGGPARPEPPQTRRVESGVARGASSQAQGGGGPWAAP